MEAIQDSDQVAPELDAKFAHADMEISRPRYRHHYLVSTVDSCTDRRSHPNGIGSVAWTWCGLGGLQRLSPWLSPLLRPNSLLHSGCP
jgi:hypothetical protein